MPTKTGFCSLSDNKRISPSINIKNVWIQLRLGSNWNLADIVAIFGMFIFSLSDTTLKLNCFLCLFQNSQTIQPTARAPSGQQRPTGSSEPRVTARNVLWTNFIKFYLWNDVNTHPITQILQSTWREEAGSVLLVVLAPTLAIHRNAHRQAKSRNEFTELFIFAGEESNQYCCICCFCKTMLPSQVTCSRITVQPIRSSTPSHWVSGKHEDAQAQLSKGLGCTETNTIELCFRWHNHLR